MKKSFAQNILEDEGLLNEKAKFWTFLAGFFFFFFLEWLLCLPILSVVERYLLLLEDKFYMLGIKFVWRSNLMSQSKGETI